MAVQCPKRGGHPSRCTSFLGARQLHRGEECRTLARLLDTKEILPGKRSSLRVMS
jgi:hypothetical protein